MQSNDCIDTIYSVVPCPQLRWRNWVAQGVTLFMRDTKALAVIVSVWAARQRDRRALAEMDSRLWNDIGLTREEVRRECAKPFWRT